MSDIAILRVENLSKAYRIGLKEQQHETMLGAPYFRRTECFVADDA